MPPKRKRNERGDGGSNRPPPFRPGDTHLGQHDRDDYGGRSSRSGGPRGPRRSDRRDPRDNFAQRGGANRPQTPTRASPISAAFQNTVTSTTTPSTAVTMPTAASAPPSPLPANYHYDVVTDEKISSWLGRGRQLVIDHGVQSRQDEDVTELSTIYQEIMRCIFDRRLDPVDGGNCVKEIVGSAVDEVDADPFGFNPPVLFLDTLSIFLDGEQTPYPPQLKAFLVATGISPTSMRQVLDAPVLQKLGLLRDTFTRMAIRAATNLLYRQANYNLLREETEGYSKLATELFGTLTEYPSSDTARMTFERIKALVGTFDLDVGRVLDVTLDVAASMLIRNFRFFVKLFRISSWWPREQVRHKSTRGFVGGLPRWAEPDHFEPSLADEEIAEIEQHKLERDVQFWERAREIGIDAFYELGGRRVTDGDLKRYIRSALEDETAAAKLEWIRKTKTLPSMGNRVAAQLLGFKLRFYQSDARGVHDQLPMNLAYLAALLIKIGFISLCDLYPHLHPVDDEMEDLREKRRKILEEEELKKRPGGGLNALMTAGALPDDTPPPGPVQSLLRDSSGNRTSEPPPDTEREKSKYKEPSEQKGQLLQDLLTIGAIPEALFFLGQFPWLYEAFPNVSNLVHRIVHHIIDKLAAETTSFLDGKHQCPSKKRVEISATVRKWAFPDDPDHQGRPHRFYWDDWADNVPVCQTTEDFFTLCDTFLNISGVKIGEDAALLTKMCRIGTKSLNEDESPRNRDRWHALLARLLVPALSLTSSNSSVTNAVWDLLQQYPNTTRFKIYSEWYEGPTSRVPAIQAAFRRAKIDTQNTMKRLSTSNILTMARSLAKTAFPSPGVVFKVALGQIEAYSNLIEAFVECARYFTPLGYDVLVWSLMNSLSGDSRSRTQESSVLLTGRWLQALSKFSGKVFRRYSHLEPTPVLYYVNDQLFKGNSTDLIILKELITSMSGIVSDVDFTDSQLAAMTGGEILRERTLKALQDNRFDTCSIISAKRLTRALVDSSVAGQLLVNLAQYVQAAMFNVADDQAHIKYLANTADETLQILQLYLDLLRHHLTPEQFDELVPAITSLLAEFGLAPRLAFLLSRGSISSSLQADKGLSSPEFHRQDASVDAEVDVPMEDKKINDAAEAPRGVDGEASTAGSGSSLSVQARQRGEAILHTLRPIVDTVRDVLPENIWKRISPEFFVLFWSLQLSDMSVPSDAYAQASDRWKKDVDSITRDRSKLTRKDMEEKKALKEDLLAKINALLEENKAHISRNIATRHALSSLNESWFVSGVSKAHLTADVIMEHCLLPRLLLSASDADYCYKLLRSLHDLRAPNITLKALLGSIFSANRLRSVLFTCTVREAQNLGRFLKHVLGDLAKWHGDKTSYEKQALGPRRQEGADKPSEKKNWPFLGFAIKFDSDGFPEKFVEHGHFRVLLFVWHKNLNMALKTCLAGSEWMHIRNAITVLKAVTEYFPAIDFMGKLFNDQLKTIHEREDDSRPAPTNGPQPRGDLSVAARTASAELIKRQPSWVIVQAFRPSLNENEETQEDVTPAVMAKLHPAAPEPMPVTPEIALRKAIAIESEDGEVKDSQNGSRPSRPQPAAHEDMPGKTGPPPRQAPSARGAIHLAQKKEAPVPKSAAPKTAPAATGTGSSPRPGPPGLPPSLPVKPNLPSRPNVPFPDHAHHWKFGQALPTSSSHREPNPRDFRDSTRGDSRDPREREREKIVREQHNSFDGPRLDRPADAQSHNRGTEPPVARDHGRSDREYPPDRGYAPPRHDMPPPPRFDRPLPERHSQDRLATHDRDVRPIRDARELRGPPIRGSSDPRAPRDSRDPSRARDAAHDPRARDQHHLESRPWDLGPSQQAPTPATDDQGPMMKPDRERTLQLSKESDRHDRSSRGEPSNTSSRACRGGAVGESRSGPRSPREEMHERRNPRRQSPRHESRTDGRTQSRANDDPNVKPDPLREDPPRRHPPRHSGRDASNTAPRRQDDRINNHGQEKTRDGHSETSKSRIPSQEHETGRLNHTDLNYGRLNAIQSVVDMAPGIPSGPRGRGSRPSGRLPPVTQPQARPDPRCSQPDPPRPKSPERFPPTGPASSRPSRRGIPSQHEPHATNPPTVPGATTPAATVSSPGANPPHDRARNISAPEAPPPQGPSHPGPRNMVPPRRSLALDNNLQRVNRPGPQTPTGPSASSDSAQARRQFRDLLGIHSEGGSSRGTPRRSQPRGSLPDSDAQVLTSGASPVTASGNKRPEPHRRDTAQGHGQGRNANANGHVPKVVDETERGRREKEVDSRSGRPSRRNSRERSPYRERDIKDGREHRERDRRSGRESDRDSSRRSLRDSGRESLPTAGSSRDLIGSGREPSSRHRDGGNGGGRSEGREGGRSDHRGEGRDEWAGVRGLGRGGPRPPELDRLRESRDDRGSRKRRSEEGLGNPEREKRVRW